MNFVFKMTDFNLKSHLFGRIVATWMYRDVKLRGNAVAWSPQNHHVSREESSFSIFIFKHKNRPGFAAVPVQAHFNV